MAARWLEQVRARLSRRGRPSHHSFPDAEDDVLAIMLDDSDPMRGWELAMQLLEAAKDEDELREVRIGVLETLLREQGDALAETFRGSIRDHQGLREAVRRIYLSGKAAEIARSEGLYGH